MLVLLRRAAVAALATLSLVAMMLVGAMPADASSKPTITRQPTSVTAAPGTKVSFVVKAKKANKYQWQRRKGSRWQPVSGARRARYTLTAQRGLNGTKYRVKVSNRGKARYSRAATLVVVDRNPRPVVDPAGSRTNPVAVGTPFASGVWQFVLEPTDTDAWPEIRATNMFNDPPRPGYSYVTVAASVSYRGGRTGTPWLNTTAQFLGSNGIVYTSSSDDQFCGVVPQGMNDVNEMYPGASARGRYCAVVPTSAVAGGLWRVSGDDDSYGSGADVFVRLS